MSIISAIRFRRASIDPNRVQPVLVRRPRPEPGEGIGLSYKSVVAAANAQANVFDPRLFMARRQDAYMARIQELTRGLKADDAALVNKAFSTAKKKFAGDTRRSGAPTLEHLVCVAEIIRFRFNLKDGELIAAALLHDILEDVDGFEYADLMREMGKGVADLVKAESKLSKEIAGKERTRKYWQNWIQAIINDPRVAVLKVADNIDNMKDQWVFIRDGKPEKAEQHAEEACKVYGAVARMLGMYDAMCYLKDQALEWLEPEKYQRDFPLYQAQLKPMEAKVDQQAVRLRRQLRQAGVNCELKVMKRPAGEVLEEVWQADLTMEEWLKTNQLALFRVVILAKPQHLAAKKTAVVPMGDVLGALVDEAGVPIYESLTNYVLNPDPDGYRAIELTVPVARQGKLIVAIMTKLMHRRNEEGILVDLRAGKRGDDYDWTPTLAQFLDQAYQTFNSDAEMRQAIAEHASFITALTPTGKKVRVHKGATYLDWALALVNDLANPVPGISEIVAAARMSRSEKIREIVLRATHVVVKESGRTRRAWLDEKVVAEATIRVESGPGEYQAKPEWLSLILDEKNREIVRQYLRSLPLEQQQRLGEDALDKFSAQFNTTWNEAMRVSFAADFIDYFNEKHERVKVCTLEDFVVIVGRGDIEPQKLGEEFNVFYSDRIRQRKKKGQLRPLALSLRVNRDKPGLLKDLTDELGKLHININPSKTYPLKQGGTSMHFVFDVASSLQVVQVGNIIRKFLERADGGEVTRLELLGEVILGKDS